MRAKRAPPLGPILAAAKAPSQRKRLPRSRTAVRVCASLCADVTLPLPLCSRSRSWSRGLPPPARSCRRHPPASAAVGSSTSECDTVPGRQCMASCFFILRQFADVNVYLASIKPYVFSNSVSPSDASDHPWLPAGVATAGVLELCPAPPPAWRRLVPACSRLRSPLMPCRSSTGTMESRWPPSMTTRRRSRFCCRSPTSRSHPNTCTSRGEHPRAEFPCRKVATRARGPRESFSMVAPPALALAPAPAPARRAHPLSRVAHVCCCRCRCRCAPCAGSPGATS